MRPLLLVAALLLAGCDAFFDPFDDRDREAAAERLEGTWALAIRGERIAPDGALTPFGTPAAREVEIAREVTCNRDQRLRSEGDLARAYVVSDPTGAAPSRECGILTVDRDGERVVFLGLTEDTAANLVEDGENRQAWHFYSALDDGTVVRTIWTLTR